MKSQKWMATIGLLSLLLCGVAQAQYMDLDVSTNIVPIGPDYGGVQTTMLKGTYTVTLTTSYSLGPNMACNKAVVYALTKGHPDSWVWVIKAGEPQTLIIEDES